MRESIEPSRVTEHVLFNLPYQPLKASASATATPHPTPPTRQLLAADPTTAAAALDMNPNMFRGYGVSLRPKDPVGTFYASERSTAHNRRQPSPAGWGHHQRTKVGRLAEGSIWAALPQLTLPARHNQTGSFCWTSRAVLPRCHSFDTGKLRQAFWNRYRKWTRWPTVSGSAVSGWQWWCWPWRIRIHPAGGGVDGVLHGESGRETARDHGGGSSTRRGVLGSSVAYDPWGRHRHSCVGSAVEKTDSSERQINEGCLCREVLRACSSLSKI